MVFFIIIGIAVLIEVLVFFAFMKGDYSNGFRGTAFDLLLLIVTALLLWG